MSEVPQTANLPPQIQYREIMGECQRLMQKIAELEVDRNEHILVEETLTPLDPSRRAYRLVGEVLVERSVAEVLPSVTTNKENVRDDYVSCACLLVGLPFRLSSQFTCSPFFSFTLLRTVQNMLSAE
jgi:chaperonin cofactor prefoldin